MCHQTVLVPTAPGLRSQMELAHTAELFSLLKTPKSCCTCSWFFEDALGIIFFVACEAMTFCLIIKST